jgi:hypothetical protein
VPPRAAEELKDALMSLQHRTEPVEPTGPESWSDYWDLWRFELGPEPERDPEPTAAADFNAWADQISDVELAMAAGGLALG